MNSSPSQRFAFPSFCLALGLLSASCSMNTSAPYRYDDNQRQYTYPGDPSNEHKIVQDVLDQTNSSNSRIEISLGEQKVRLYRVAGGQKQLAVETRISTGREGNNTPVGQFSVLEKLPTKNSSLYGSWVDGTSGALLQGDGDSRQRPSGGSPEFQGAPMPYWLRITGDGVGMHVGYVPSYPASHGCIRVSRRIQPLIYERVRVGTPVSIRH